MILVIAPLLIIGTILFGGLIAWVFAGVDTAVKKNYVEVENKDKGYNQRLTFGYRVDVTEGAEAQVKEARLESARQAATTARGANVRIGSKGAALLTTAGAKESLEHDPWSAAKIAQYHGWDGAQTGAVIATAVPGAVVIGAVAAPVGKIKLEPGKDYDYIEITDGMSPDDKRKARIANSKAKSAAMKVAKAAQQAGGVVPTAAPVATTAGAQPVAAAPMAAAAVDIEAPVFVDLSDDMAPDEKRKARIANSKAKSAFNKQLKAAGIDPKTVEIVDGKVVIPASATPVVEAVAAPVAEVAPVAASTAVVTDIPKPDLIEITDDMDPNDKRKARIANSKAKSAYNKALKAAGIDPKSVAS